MTLKDLVVRAGCTTLRVMRCAAVIILLGAALGGCDDDEITVIDVGPTGPPCLYFADNVKDAVDVNGDRKIDCEELGAAYNNEAACTSIGTDASTRIPLLLNEKQLVLHPPGTCGAFAQCGHVVLYAGGVANNESSVRTVELLLNKLGDRYHDGETHEGTGQPDYLQLRIEVLNDDYEPVLDQDGDPLGDETDLITAVDCDEL